MTFAPILNAPGANLPAVGANAFSFPPLPQVSKIMAMLDAIGATAVRIEVSWAATELALGVYAVPRDVDAWISACLESGRKVVIVLDYGNALYPGSGAYNLPPRDAASVLGFANYAAYVVSQYASPSVWFEIYNEPNNPTFWANAVSASQYAALLTQCITKMRAVSGKGATAQIISAGVGSVASIDDEVPFMAAVATAVGSTQMAKLTGQAIHPYDATNAPERLSTFISNYQTGVPYAGPMPITEVGWPIQWLTGETERTLYTTRMIGCAILAGVPLMTLYNLFDTGADQTNVQYTFGLHKFDFTPKPVVAAVKAMMAALAGTVTYDAESLTTPNIYRITLRKADGTTTKIIWSDQPTTSIFESMKTVLSLNDVNNGSPWFRFQPGGIMITVGLATAPQIITGTV